MAHQLGTDLKTLKTRVLDYLCQQGAKYQDMLIPDGRDGSEGTSIPGEQRNNMTMDEYVLRFQLKGDAYWAGGIEFDAVSKVYRREIYTYAWDVHSDEIYQLQHFEPDHSTRTGPPVVLVRTEEEPSHWDGMEFIQADTVEDADTNAEDADQDAEEPEDLEGGPNKEFFVNGTIKITMAKMVRYSHAISGNRKFDEVRSAWKAARKDDVTISGITSYMTVQEVCTMIHEKLTPLDPFPDDNWREDHIIEVGHNRSFSFKVDRIDRAIDKWGKYVYTTSEKKAKEEVLKVVIYIRDPGWEGHNSSDEESSVRLAKKKANDALLPSDDERKAKAKARATIRVAGSEDGEEVDDANYSGGSRSGDDTDDGNLESEGNVLSECLPSYQYQKRSQFQKKRVVVSRAASSRSKANPGLTHWAGGRSVWPIPVPDGPGGNVTMRQTVFDSYDKIQQYLSESPWLEGAEVGDQLPRAAPMNSIVEAMVTAPFGQYPCCLGGCSAMHSQVPWDRPSRGAGILDWTYVVETNQSNTCEAHRGGCGRALSAGTFVVTTGMGAEKIGGVWEFQAWSLSFDAPTTRRDRLARRSGRTMCLVGVCRVPHPQYHLLCNRTWVVEEVEPEVLPWLRQHAHGLSRLRAVDFPYDVELGTELFSCHEEMVPLKELRVANEATSKPSPPNQAKSPPQRTAKAKGTSKASPEPSSNEASTKAAASAARNNPKRKKAEAHAQAAARPSTPSSSKRKNPDSAETSTKKRKAGNDGPAKAAAMIYWQMDTLQQGCVKSWLGGDQTYAEAVPEEIQNLEEDAIAMMRYFVGLSTEQQEEYIEQHR